MIGRANETEDADKNKTGSISVPLCCCQSGDGSSQIKSDQDSTQGRSGDSFTRQREMIVKVDGCTTQTGSRVGGGLPEIDG